MPYPVIASPLFSLMREAYIDTFPARAAFVPRGLPGWYERNDENEVVALVHLRLLGPLEPRDRDALRRLGIEVREGSWRDAPGRARDSPIATEFERERVFWVRYDAVETDALADEIEAHVEDGYTIVRSDV